MRFQFNLLEQTLKITSGADFLIIPKEQKFFCFRSLRFILDPDQPEHRILFSVCQEKVQALYWVPQKDGSVVGYKREISRPASGVVEVEFSEWDRIKKLHFSFG